MVDRRSATLADPFKTLWSLGAVGEPSDAALVARFSARRDVASEAAFRLLVDRHAPMVLRVCRQVLGDGHDAEDAAQAVFLVLARKAGSIRKRTSVAPWLHGVAHRVAAKARHRAFVRRTNEARTALGAARAAALAPDPKPASDWEALHDEVARLPEKYRSPVVLCYLEGQTYEDAARRLGCPVGTVRVRLSRARDRLRDRLTRRGFGPSAVAQVAWLGSGPAPVSTFTGAELLPSGAWVEATIQAAQAFTTGRAAGAGVVSGSVLVLTRGVIRSMLISKLRLGALGLLAAGLVGSGAGVLIGQEPAPRQRSREVSASPPRDEPTAPKPVGDKLISEARVSLSPQKLVDAAKKRLDTQRKFYEEGRITIDRYIDASHQLAIAETEAATTTEGRVAAAQGHLTRLNETSDRERKELDVGRGTLSDVVEAEVARIRAVNELSQAHEGHSSADFAALERRVVDLERKLDRVIKQLSRSSIEFPRR